MLKDNFGRTFPYIRLSITDICNFKCGYCLPNGYQIDKSDNRKFLHLDEIRRLAKALSELGVSKIRLTGGEPTVRKDFFDIVKTIKENSGIKKTVITTNGYHLDKIAHKINESGLDGINISIDSLNRETFKKITGHDRLDEILKGIKVLQSFDFKNIKTLDVQTIFHKMEQRTLSAALKFYCNQELINAHSAMADTQATHDVLMAQLDRYKDLEGNINFLSEFTTRNKSADLAGFIIFNKQGEECFSFGKHKGKSVDSILENEPGYFGWLLNADFPMYTKKVLTAIRLRKLNTE